MNRGNCRVHFSFFLFVFFGFVFVFGSSSFGPGRCPSFAYGSDSARSSSSVNERFPAVHRIVKGVSGPPTEEVPSVTLVTELYRVFFSLRS